jgi:predicted nucleic acid-binding protein
VALLIDTDVLIELERSSAAAGLEDVLGEEERAISVITMSELLHRALHGTGAIRSRRSAFVEHLLAGLQAIPITEAVARSHAAIWAELAGRGEPIGAHDLWIAATALAHGHGVATGNAAHFDRVSGLRVVAVSS